MFDSNKIKIVFNKAGSYLRVKLILVILSGLLVLVPFELTPAATAADTNNFSPIHVNADFLFLYRQSTLGKEDLSLDNRNGLDLQEGEVIFFADVDPFHRAQLTLTIHPQYQLDNGRVTQSWGVEPEEVFAEALEIPWTTLKIGKFKAAFGKVNLKHTHDLPFVDAPLVHSKTLGGEGLNDVGVSAAILMPTSWYNELTLQYLRGEGENSEFSSPTPGDGVGLVHWKNFGEINDETTLEVGVSYAAGKNSLLGTTSLSGGDLTIKWRPEQGGLYRSLVFSAERIYRNLQQPGAAVDFEKSYGDFFWLKGQFALQWSVYLGYEYFNSLGGDALINPLALKEEVLSKKSVGMIFSPSEFSFYRLEFSQTNGLEEANGNTTDSKINTDNKLCVQANFIIGAHPAHIY